MITTEQKQEIQEKLNRFISTKGSQNKAATALDVSTATISHIVNGAWDSLADTIWRKVAAGIGYTGEMWEVVKTTPFKQITGYLTDAKQYSNVHAFVLEAGEGKTEAIKAYTSTSSNVYHLMCSEFWTKRYFLKQLLRQIGVDPGGYTLPEMMDTAIEELLKKDRPLIIFDEVDKLKDPVLYFFITLFNMLEGKCGMVFSATPHLETRIVKGARVNKKGYKEIYSRLGRKFIRISEVSFTDVAKICTANGVTDQTAIKKIFDDCEYDLRRVKKKVHAYKKSNQKK